MNDKYIKTVELLQENYEDLRRGFAGQGDLSKHLIALNYAVNNKRVDIDKLKSVVKYFKSKTSVFSPLRGPSYFSILGMITSDTDDPEGVIDFITEHTQTIKNVGFKQSNFFAITLYTISKVYNGNDVEGFAMKAMPIYKEMKKNHPLLTSGDDYALAMLLASCNHHPDSIEAYYTELNKNKFVKCNGLQMLSHILAYNPSSVELTVDKCVAIAQQLKDEKLKITQTYYPAIGLISMLDQEHIQDVIEVTHYLAKHKRYKWLGKGMNVMIASSIVCNEYIVSNKEINNTAMQVTIQAIVSAQQVAMIAAAAGTSAAVVT